MERKYIFKETTISDERDFAEMWLSKMLRSKFSLAQGTSDNIHTEYQVMPYDRGGGVEGEFFNWYCWVHEWEQWFQSPLWAAMRYLEKRMEWEQRGKTNWETVKRIEVADTEIKEDEDEG